MESIIKVYDTSALLDLSDSLVLDKDCYISVLVINELENIKTSFHKDNDIKMRARQVVRLLQQEQFTTNLKVSAKIDKMVKKYASILPDNTDSRILLEACLNCKHYNEVHFYTGDLTLYLFGKNLFNHHNNFYVHLTSETSKKRFWDGFKEIIPTDEQWTKLYDLNNHTNFFNLKINEYAILYKDNNSPKAICRWDGENYVQLGYKPIKSMLLGHIEPRNLEQKCYFDLLQNPDIPIVNCIGKNGSGKTFLAIAAGLDMIDNGTYSKLIYIRNNFGVENTKDPGALPGTLEEKLQPFLGPLVDIIGDETMVEQLINEGKIEQMHLGYLRGRNLQDCFVIVDESQNLTPGHIKMLISRMAENSKLVFCGDYSQTDSTIFRHHSNGLLKMNEKLQGNSLYGQIRLNKVERSKICQLADLIN